MWVLQIAMTSCLIFPDSCVTPGQENNGQQILAILQLLTDLAVQNTEQACTESIIFNTQNNR